MTPPPELLAAGTADEAVAAALDWVRRNTPPTWVGAAESGGAGAVRQVRSTAEYRAWYPTFAGSGLAVPAWPVPYGGLGWAPAVAAAVDRALRPYHLPRLNPLGLNLAAPALFAHGTEEQRLRYLPPIVRNDEVWCQLFSEPGAGSDLASLSTRAERDGDRWLITGQKVWTTWAHLADYAVLLARTDPDAPKRAGITYFLIALDQPGVEIRPLRHIGGEIDFNEVFLDGAVVPDAQRVGTVNDGWRVARATLSGERQMVSGSGSGGVDRIGGAGAGRLVRLAKERAAAVPGTGWDDPLVRAEITRLWAEEQLRSRTNQRVRATVKAGRAPGPESSIGKVHGSDLNQRIQARAAALLGPSRTTWPAAADAWDDAVEAYPDGMPAEVRGALRSRANTIEGGTTEVNKNIIAERVLGLPREPDPWEGKPWREVPRG
ncbi:acyl-CoA dehydrogenase family protein [Cryptosporangium aurantiacum]|uniref:Acyl-CoA dehydrogenase n=1 Tax=Cryptosporangium aurantiacum TaxID=134849 RepID=A0A1M7RJW0_9ACTN|nr:acyl-CoA dehydrogenase family protein [Cryptosporangium aurantiacum]SHN46554.1 Acyl-CoA dehydrogenase [Cryptosporangium aurantiacum]